jgi:hypothetical protein
MKTRRIWVAPGDWTRFEQFAKQQGLTLEQLVVQAAKGRKGVK